MPQKILVCFIFPVFIFSGSVFSQPAGSIDKTFGSSGIQLVNLVNRSQDDFFCLGYALLPDGGYFISGNHTGFNNDGNNAVIIKIKKNGEGDSSFSMTGFKKFGIGNSSGGIYSHAIFYQPASNKIIVFTLPSTNDIITIYRFKMNGDADSAFGTNGVKYASIKNFNNQYTDVSYQFIHQQSDGKIVIGGTANVNSSNNRVFLYRLTVDGDYDLSFGVSGSAEYFTSAYSAFKLFYAGKDDAVFAAVSRGVVVSAAFVDSLRLIKVDRDGHPDNSFGANGLKQWQANFGYSSNSTMKMVQLHNGNTLILYNLSNSFGAAGLYMIKPDGAFDSSFHGTGLYKTFYLNGTATAMYSMIKLSNDEIRVLVGNYQQPNNTYSMIRIKSNGDLDSGYTSSGLYSAKVSMGNFKGSYTLWDVNNDSSHIMGFGNLTNDSGTRPNIIRLNTDGRLDSGFATNGIAPYEILASQDHLLDMQSLGTGKTILLGYEDGNGNLSLTRLDSAGSLDQTFGDHGVKLLNPLSSNGILVKPITQEKNPADVSSYYISFDGNKFFTLGKLNNNGEFDPFFGTNGLVTVPVNTPIYKVQKAIHLSDGKFLVLINDNEDIILVRLNADGTKDNTFGTNGIATIDEFLTFCTGFCFGTRDLAQDMIYTSDGKILVTSSLIGNATYFYSGVFRLNNNGSSDASFGTNGIVFLGPSSFTINTVALAEQSDKKYLVTVNRFNASAQSVGNYIVRYNYDGSQDGSFTPTTIPNITAGTYSIAHMDIQRDKKINIVSTSDPAYAGRPYVVRIKPSGGIDSSFANNGIFLLDTLRILASADATYGNYAAIQKDVQGRLLFGLVGQRFQKEDLMVTRLLTGDSAAKTTALQFTRYVVKFKDKNGTPYTFSNPLAYLSQRAIDRRTRYGIAIDSTDLPVNSSYITQIKNVPNVTLLNVSKWFNAVTIQTTDSNALAIINGFSFVTSSSAIAARIGRKKSFEDDFSSDENSISRTKQTQGNYFNYGTTSFNEIHLHNGEFLHNIGLRGQGMQIAMLDNGFNNYTSSSFHAFDSVNANHAVLDTWDFVARNQIVSDDGNHGMSCFSIIAGNIPGQFIGKSPEANFELYQTEDNTSEYPIEEFNWACGAERADSSGADVISSSLGYSTFDDTSFDHTYADMNGKTTIAAIAADQAAKKGLLVFIANGNSGTDSWHYLTTPADGDSVIAVGAVDVNGVVGAFSSYGPSSDGRIKPDVSSVGVSAYLQTATGGLGFGNGTSFACPNMAGLGTCLWQGFPEFNNMKIRSALWKAGSISSAPDDRIGYGIPDMKKAFANLLIDFSSANGSISNCKTTINWTSKDVSAMKYELERKVFGEANYTKIADVNTLSNIGILTNHSYQQTDTLINAQAGTVSYRIRQIIDTTAATFTAVYIDTVNIVLNASCVTTAINPVNPNNKKINIIPNPAHDQLTLRVETSNPILSLGIDIVDMKGSSVLQFVRSKGSGAANFDLPVYRLSRGKYTIVLYDGEHFFASKEFIKL